MKRHLIAAGIATALVFAASAANAAFVYSSASGNFVNPTGTEGTEVISHVAGAVGNNNFAYGTDIGQGPNILTFTSGSAATVNQGNEFVLGNLSYHNSSTTGNDEFVTVTLDINPVIAVNGTSVNAAANYLFSIDNTSNAPPCQFPGGDPCADQVTITALSAGVQTFTIGSQTLQLFVDGFLGSDGKIHNTFVGSENTTTTAQLVGRFDLTSNTSPVPEPASWALMMLGFGGLGAMLRHARAGRAVAKA